ncbi:hypothetical protein C7N43_37640 [Sphingobacteriales bacterium UPWRP_1]|nr:hypothetical protein C7N43_37640 [Sphingobacteriales bacterium UPWRP_1]
MFQAIKQYLNSRGWNYQLSQQQGHQIFKLQLHGENGAISCVIDVQEETVILFTIFPVNAPQEKRHAMAELITRINFKLLLGHFELDFEDGEVRFNLSWHFDDTVPVSDAVIEHNIMACAIISDKFIPAIMRINFSNITPVMALEEVEGVSRSSLN